MKKLLPNEVPLAAVSLLLDHKKVPITGMHYVQFVPEWRASIESRSEKYGHTQGKPRNDHHKDRINIDQQFVPGVGVAQRVGIETHKLSTLSNAKSCRKPGAPHLGACGRQPATSAAKSSCASHSALSLRG